MGAKTNNSIPGKLFRFLRESRFWIAFRILVKGVPRSRPRDPFLSYDESRFLRYSGHGNPNGEEAVRGRIAACCHVLEKGLAMPDRRPGFGQGIVRQLVPLLERFESRVGTGDRLLGHAIGVLHAYWEVNAPALGEGEALAVRDLLSRFLDGRPAPPAGVVHCRRADLFAKKDAPFPEFARSRHTVRNYVPGRPVPPEKIRAAVDVAREAPSSCNRQPCRVRRIEDPATMARVLELQGGSRGFGHLAGTLLLVTVDLADATHARERNDPFVCGGMFLMALSYALFHEEVAHCILNWSRTPAEDLALRKILRLAPSESVVAALSCGLAPDEFDLCESPRKPLSEVLVGDAAAPPCIAEERRK